MIKLFHYYHVYADAEGWEPILRDHITAVMQSGLYYALESGGFVIGIAGEYKNACDVRNCVSGYVGNIRCETDGPTTWEQATLHPLWRRARFWQARGVNGAVLYAHTKGVANPSDRQTAWRERMTNAVVVNWKDCLDAIELLSADVVGAYHLVNDGEAQKWAGDGADIVAAQLNDVLGTELKVGPVFPEQGQAIFAGNFWWSTLEWIASLNTPGTASRYDAETWIGNANKDGKMPVCYNLERWLAQ